MIGVIIITHGDLGKELLASAERILGKQEYVELIPVHVGDGLKNIRNRISDIIKDAGFPREKIILVDIFGGTPSNASLFFAKVPGVEILSGLNLPALIALFYARDNKISAKLISGIIGAGQKGIIDIKNKMLEKLGK